MFLKRGRGFSALALILCTGVVSACGGDDNDSSSSSSSSSSTETTQVKEVQFSGSIEEGVEEGYPEPEKASLTIGMSTGLAANELLRTVETAARLETEALGGKFISLDAGGKPDKQVSDIQQLISRKVDAIVITLLDVNAVGPVVKQAQAAGIPVFAQDANLDAPELPEGFTGQVWQGRDYSAYLQAQLAAERMDEGAGFGQIGFVVKVPTIEKALERAAFWGEKYGIKALGRVDNPSDDIAGGEEAMTQLLGQHPDMKGVIAYNEESATGAASAARAAGKRDLVFIGVNGGSAGFEAVEAGRIDATVQFQVPNVGRFLVWGAYNAVAGNDVAETVYAGQPKAVTPDTIEDVPTWEDTLTERYGKSS